MDEKSQQAIFNTKFPIGTRATARCKSSPDYFLHGEVVSFTVNTLIYTVYFDWKDNADPQHYTEVE